MPAASARGKIKKCQKAWVMFYARNENWIVTHLSIDVYDVGVWKWSVRGPNLVQGVLARSCTVIFQLKMCESRCPSGMLLGSKRKYMSLIHLTSYLRQLEEQLSKRNDSLNSSELEPSRVSPYGASNDVDLSTPNQNFLLEDQRWREITQGISTCPTFFLKT